MPMPLTNRKIATVLWLVVALLAAATITSLWNLTPRQQVFFYIVSPGLVLLLSLNSRRQPRPLLPQKLMSGIIEQLPTPSPKEPLPLTPPPPKVTAPAANKNTVPTAAQPLTAAEAREWLDEFLVKQQQS